MIQRYHSPAVLQPIRCSIQVPYLRYRSRSSLGRHAHVNLTISELSKLLHSNTSTAMSTTTAAPKSVKSSPPQGTIDVLNNDIARIYANIHPVILLSSFFFTFPSLVKDPMTALFGSLLPLSILQTVYAGLCLPGSNSSTLNASQKPGQRKKGSSKDAPGIGFKLVVCVFRGSS